MATILDKIEGKSLPAEVQELISREIAFSDVFDAKEQDPKNDSLGSKIQDHNSKLALRL